MGYLDYFGALSRGSHNIRFLLYLLESRGCANQSLFSTSVLFYQLLLHFAGQSGAEREQLDARRNQDASAGQPLHSVSDVKLMC